MLVQPTKEADAAVAVAMEALRVEALRRYELLDAPPEAAFDNITQIMLQVFAVPLAFIALVDSEQVFFVSRAGALNLATVDRRDSLCSVTVQQSATTIFEDTAAHPYLLERPDLLKELSIRFYAGTPLRTPEGFNIGTIAVAGMDPRAFNSGEKMLLERFARTVMHDIEQRLVVRQQTRMRESNQKLVTLVNNSIELMSVLELDGKNSYLNKAGMEMLGFDNLEQVLLTPIADLHTPGDIAFVETNVLPSVMGTGRWSGQMNVRHLKTGEIFPVYNNTIRIDDPLTGQPIAIGAVMRDMRPELAAQQELVISEDEMRNALEAAEMGYWNVDPKTLQLRCNKRTKELFGLPESDVVDLELAISAIHPHDRERVNDAMIRALQYASGGEYDIEYSVISHGDRKLRIIRAKGRTYFDEQRQPSQFSGTVQDVTAQRRQEQKLRMMLESLPLMAWTTNAAGAVDYYNRGWYAYTGQLPEEALGSGWVRVMHPGDVERMTARWEQSVRSGEVFEQEARYQSKAGSYRWHLTRGVPIKDDVGVVLFWTGTCTDIHDQKAAAEVLEQKIGERTRQWQEANQQLERTNLELEQFAHVSSHDLQEPLRKITMFTEMVRESSNHLLDPAARVRLQKVVESARRMSESLKALLNYTQVQKEEQWEVIDMDTIVHHVLSDLELVVQSKMAQITTAPLPAIKGQAHQVKQLFYNLIHNALKFTHPNRAPEIKITAQPISAKAVPEGLSKDRSYTHITIRDNGIGFNATQSEKIFTLFQRLHNRSEYPGTGIGLALCKKVVQKHGGLIYAEAEPDEGAVFHLLLPLA